MAVLLRVLLSVLTVACVPAVRSEEDYAQLDSNTRRQQDVQGNTLTEMHGHLSRKSGSQDEEGKPACCKCKSGGHKYMDNSGKCTKDCPVFQYQSCS